MSHGPFDWYNYQKYRLHLRGIPQSSSTSDLINGSDYPPAATPRHDQAYYRALNKWLNPGPEDSDHGSIGGGAAAAAAPTTMENEKKNVNDDKEPAELNFGSWLNPFGSSGIWNIECLWLYVLLLLFVLVFSVLMSYVVQTLCLFVFIIVLVAGLLLVHGPYCGLIGPY